MSRNSSPANSQNRKALVIFSALAFTFIAQLVWWVIFQFALINKRYDDYQGFAKSRQVELVARYESEMTFARSMLSPQDSLSAEKWLVSLESALEQSALIEAVVYFDESGSPHTIGKQTQRSIARSGPGARVVVHLDFAVIDSVAASGNPKLSFAAPDDLTIPLQTVNFPFDSLQSETYRDVRDTSIRMHLAEGGFFVALIFAGLALIYRALKRSEESRSAQENFLMAVTHELKTPLASLKLGLHGLRRGKLDSAHAEKANLMIDTDIDRLDSLITDLLDAGKDAHTRVAKPEELKLKAYLNEYFSSRESEFLQRSVTVKMFSETDARGVSQAEQSAEVVVLIGRADIKRVIDIVVDNAIKFSDKTAELNVNLRIGSRTAELRISDSGMGLDPREVSRIFERFYRVGQELTRNRPGAGLGLYLGREIMRSYNGGLSAESSGVDKGTTLILSVPLSSQKR